MPAYFDNIQILRAIDERKQHAEGRPLWISAYQLLSEISGMYAPSPKLMPGFLQERSTVSPASWTRCAAS